MRRRSPPRPARRALADAAVAADEIDAVVVSTCTGYLCPGLSGYVVERLGLRADVQAFDLVGQGCAAALPNFQLGRALLGSGAAAHVLSICVEVSSAAMYLDDDPGVLISACLFGDGAGAAVLSNEPKAGARRIGWRDGASLIEPAERKALMFEQRGGMLRNILTREVPALAAEHAQRLLGTVLGRAGLDSADIGAWILHAGGRDVLQARRAPLRARRATTCATARRCCASTATCRAPSSTSCSRPRSPTTRPTAGGGCRRSAPASPAMGRCWRWRV